MYKEEPIVRNFNLDADAEGRLSVAVLRRRRDRAIFESRGTQQSILRLEVAVGLEVDLGLGIGFRGKLLRRAGSRRIVQQVWIRLSL